MKEFPVIGIVSRFDIDKKKKNLTKINEIGEQYVKVVNKYGGLPIGLLPVQDILFTDLASLEVPKLTALDKEKIIKVLNICDGIILPGGGRWYEYEEFICQYAYNHDIPLLGICQGMQIMAYVARKENENELDEYKTYLNNTKIKHYSLGIKYAHSVNIYNNTRLFNILKSNQILVNSRHNYNVGLVKNLTISAVSEDGIVEAIEEPNLRFYIGIQWHPENMDEYDKNQGNIIKEFINACKYEIC